MAVEVPIKPPEQENVQDMAALWAAAEKELGPVDDSEDDGAEADEADEEPKEPAAEEPEEPEDIDEESDEDAEGEEEEGEDKKKPSKKKPEDEDKEGKVHPRERIKFREEKRKAREQIVQMREQAAQDIESAWQRLQKDADVIARFNRAVESEDWDEAARAVGRNDWNELQKEVLQRHQNPVFKRQLELERKLRAREEQDAEAERRVQAERQAQEQHAARVRYRDNMVGELKRAEDPIVAKLAAEDSQFANLLLSLHEDHFRAHGDIDDESADDMLNSAVLTVRETYEKLHKVFGDQATSVPEKRSGTKQPARSTQKRHKSVSRSKAVEASSPREMTDAEWFKMTSKQLANSKFNDD